MLVNIGPIVVAVLAAVFLGEGFPPRLAGGTVIGFAGVVLIGLATSSGGRNDVWGVVLCVVAAVSAAVSMIAQKPLVGRLPALEVTWLACTIGALACLPFAPELFRDVDAAGERGDRLGERRGVGRGALTREPVLQVQREEACHSCGANRSDTELMQNRSPVGVCGASSNTWPRCESHAAHRTSVRTMPCARSSTRVTASPSVGW